MNMSNITNSTNLYQMFIEINNLSNNTFILMFIFFLFIILYSTFNKLGHTAVKSALFSSAIIIIINTLLFVLGFINWIYLMISIILFFGLFIAVKFSSE